MPIVGTYDTAPKTATGEITKGLTKGLSSGLIGVLDKLTESKLKEIDRQRTAQGLVGAGFEEQEAKGISQLNPDIQKEIIRDQFAARKEGAKTSQKVVHDVVAAEKASRDNLAALNRIEELDKKGNVQGITGQILNKVGLGRYRNADTQELEKLTVNFLSNLKNVFGARPTNLDVTNYMKSIPSLAQSPEGRARVIKNLRVYNQAAEIRGKALREILKENKGRAPHDLELQLEDRIGPQLDQLNAQISDSPTGAGSESIFQTLPDPAQYAGKTVKGVGTDEGKIFKSDGTRWIPVGA